MMMRQWLIFCFLVLAAQPGHGIRGGGISSLEDNVSKMIQAAKDGQLDKVDEHLKTENVDVNARSQEGWTALMWASNDGLWELVRLLLTQDGIDANQRNDDGKNAFMLAAENGHMSVVGEFLLNSAGVGRWDHSHVPCDLNAKDLHGMTALMLAVQQGRTEVVDFLLSNDVDEDCSSDETKSPRVDVNKEIRVASSCGQMHTVEMLLAHQSIVNGALIHSVSVSAIWTAMMCAILNGDCEMVTSFLADPRVEMNEIETAGIHKMTSFGCLEHAINFLITDPSLQFQDPQPGCADALFWIIRTNRRDALDILLQVPHVNPNARDGQGRTPLILASELGLVEAAEALLCHEQIDVNAKIMLSEQEREDGVPTGQTALMIAVGCGQKDMVQLLLRNPDINVNAADTDLGWTALFYLASTDGNNTGRILELLFESEVEVNATDKFGRTALIISLMNLLGKNADVMITALLQQRDIDARSKCTKVGYTPFMWAAVSNPRSVELLLKHCPDINIDEKDSNGKNAFMLAIEYGQKSVVEMFLKKSMFDVNTIYEISTQAIGIGIVHVNALMYAVLMIDAAIVEILLRHPDINMNMTDKEGNNALHLAVKWSPSTAQMDVITLLLQDGRIDVDATNKNNETALALAEHKDVSRALTSGLPPLRSVFVATGHCAELAEDGPETD